MNAVKSILAFALGAALWLTAASLVVLILVVVEGWVLATLWPWFVLPMGVPNITWIQGAGIMLIVVFLRGGASRILEQLKDQGLTPEAITIMIPTAWLIISACVLACGYALHVYGG